MVRALHGDLAAAPDLVAYPASEADVVDAARLGGRRQRVAVIPYGAGSSVVGGVEYRGSDHRGVVSLDMSTMDRWSRSTGSAGPRGSRPAPSGRRWRTSSARTA